MDIRYQYLLSINGIDRFLCQFWLVFVITPNFYTRMQDFKVVSSDVVTQMKQYKCAVAHNKHQCLEINRDEHE